MESPSPQLLLLLLFSVQAAHVGLLGQSHWSEGSPGEHGTGWSHAMGQIHLTRRCMRVRLLLLLMMLSIILIGRREGVSVILALGLVAGAARADLRQILPLWWGTI